MKNAIFILILAGAAGAVFGGCKAYDSLIGHPLHVLHEQHENAEATRKAEAAFTNANDWQSAEEAIRLRTEQKAQ